MSYTNILEEELKNKVAKDYFAAFDCTKIVGNIDFCVTYASPTQGLLFETESMLWAEAKKGNKNDIYESFVQLILTIGKARTFDNYLPPKFLGAFDADKIAFVPYNNVHEIFYQNDFNWKITPSDHQTKEFKQVYNKVKTSIESNSLLFNFDADKNELHAFIQTNFTLGKAHLSKTRIDKNNFIIIYNKWVAAVKPSIGANWDIAKKHNIIDGDFYLADLLSLENETLKEKLSVLLKKDYYELERNLDEMGMFNSKKTFFTDNQKAHSQFWNKYERPPKEEYWDYIVERRDLLVPQDVRERKGSFYTPQLWVELSQRYLTDVLGDDWQDEYYVWDCAAGTGNLLTGLTNKYNVWASTLDRQDVDVMKDRIKNGANLLEDHVFQFDFLNDDFTKLPKALQNIINDPNKRKKLVVYINPPYAEHGNRTTIIARGKHKTSVSTTSKVYNEFNNQLGTATRELFAQFFLRIYKELPNTKLASFSTLKFINSQNFFKFRQYFKAEYKKGFICNANTFDNVNGNFPIGFLIWDLANKNDITKVKVNVALLADGHIIKSKIKTKTFYAFGKNDFISRWLRSFYDKVNDEIGYLILPGVDMQQQNGVYVTSQPTPSDIAQHKTARITQSNLIEMAIYLSIRQSVALTWVNNKDQFLYPNDGWKSDTEFQHDCFALALFHGQNKITSKAGTNHWIPFSESEVNSHEKFDSDFMSKFIKGKIKPHDKPTIFTVVAEPTAHYEVPLHFSPQAKAVFGAALELWRYYHAQEGCNVNASLYDIKEYFQGRNENGKMNTKSLDDLYIKQITTLREALKVLSQKIEPKVYEYGFLK